MLAPLFLASGGELRLPSFFSDHMVLQRETRAPLWGWAEPLEQLEIRASWEAGRALEVEADREGSWRTELVTPAAGGPFEITIQGEDGAVVLHDVLVGEVWLASGQSNMEWTLGPVIGGGVEGWEEAVRTASDPELRVFDVANDARIGPNFDCSGSWRISTPESARATSATAHFFARKLRAELDLPVGMITADWGGTPAEAWTSAEALAPFPEFAETLAFLRDFVKSPMGFELEWQKEHMTWWLELAGKDPGSMPVLGWMAEDHRDQAWATLDLPATWEQHGLADFDGLAWYRRAVELPPDWAGKELVLELGAIDDRDTTWWNGESIGGYDQEGQWQTPRRYTVPAKLVKAGRNVLAVRVLDTGGLGGFHGAADALRVFQASDESHVLSLAGTWRWKRGASLADIDPPPSRPGVDQNSPSVLWNGMLAPLAPFALRGAIWYQGESNRERADQYRALFPALIRDWRARFGREFPFYFVQIAPFAYAGDTGEAARLRDAQRRALELPHTGMAVTMDIGDPADIHPAKKREVGERLALWALARSYGRELECSGPLYRSMKAEEKALRLEFDHAAGLTSRGEPVRHVTVAGEDRVFHPGAARIEGETLVVSSPAVSRPVAARFGWGAADQTNLWNAAGLPAASFRTDDWP